MKNQDLMSMIDARNRENKILQTSIMASKFTSPTLSANSLQILGHAFLSLNVSPTLRVQELFASLGDETPDAANLAEDWNNVGSDIWHSRLSARAL